MVEEVSKDQHGLIIADINNIDRMNYTTTVKISEKRVQKCFEKHVNGSIFTVLYLKYISYATSSLINTTLTATQRVRRIWQVVFLCVPGVIG